MITNSPAVGNTVRRVSGVSEGQSQDGHTISANLSFSGAACPSGQAAKDGAEAIRKSATLTSQEIIGWFRFVTGFYCTGRNWLPGEKAALIQRAEQLRVKIAGLNA